MPNQQVALTQTAIGRIVGKDASGNVAPIQNVTLSIDRYDVAYVAAYQGEGGPHGYMVVPKDPAQIGTITVTITATGQDANGLALSPVTDSYDIVGNPPPPPATSLNFVIPSPSVGSFPGTPADPGSATVSD